MRIIVFGSRGWHDQAMLESVLDRAQITKLVHGDCPSGADYLARLYAQARHIPQERHPAAWDLLGRRAGPIRNTEIAELGGDCAIGFRFIDGDSNGTDHMWGECLRCKIPGYVFFSNGDFCAL